MDAPLCLLTVHAHPDDEASKGAGTVNVYHQRGVRTVLVCCTGGEEGDILNPAMDTDEVKADIGVLFIDMREPGTVVTSNRMKSSQVNGGESHARNELEEAS